MASWRDRFAFKPGLGAGLGNTLRQSAAGRWFQEQSERDRRLLTLLAAFLVVVTFWLLIWLPVQDGLAIAENRHARALADQRWISQHQATLAQLAGRQSDAGPRSGQALLSTVAGSARSNGISLNRFQPEGGNALAVSLEDVTFAELVVWLEALNRDEGIRVRSANLDVQSQPGRVRARILLH